MRVSSSPCVLTLLTMSSCTLKVSTCLWRFLIISSAMYVSWIWFSIFKRFVITYFPLHLCLAFSSVDFLAILVPIFSIDFGTSIIWLLLLFSDSSYICCLCLKLLFAEHYKLLVLLQVYLILDEFILAGELQETSKKVQLFTTFNLALVCKWTRNINSVHWIYLTQTQNQWDLWEDFWWLAWLWLVASWYAGHYRENGRAGTTRVAFNILIVLFSSICRHLSSS